MDNTNVYNCVIDSVNNILKNGLDYYKDKDSNIYDKIDLIYKYVNKYKIQKNNKFSNKRIKKSIDDNFLDELYKIKLSIIKHR